MAFVLLFAMDATAKSFAMSGHWYLSRTPLIDLPLNGGPELCIGGSIQTGCVGFLRPRDGGVPGMAVVTQMGSSPASFTIPPGAFGQAKGIQGDLIAIVPTVVQIVTSLSLSGPASLAQATMASPTFAAAQPARFQSNAHTRDPGQTAGSTPRAAANFAWCPGVGGPACPSGLAATGSPGIQGIVTYTAGANVFGGTMAMLVKGNATVSRVWSQLTSASQTLLAHTNLIAPATGFMNPQVVGAGYAYANSSMLPLVPLYLIQSGMMVQTSMGLLATPGLPITSNGTPATPYLIQADTQRHWGFPWTTGTVSVMNTETYRSQVHTGTLTAMGSDARTPGGKGQIVMVAGGTSHRVAAQVDFEALGVVVLTFDDATPTPALDARGLAALIIVLALAAGHSIRRRFVR